MLYQYNYKNYYHKYIRLVQSNHHCIFYTKKQLYFYRLLFYQNLQLLQDYHTKLTLYLVYLLKNIYIDLDVQLLIQIDQDMQGVGNYLKLYQHYLYMIQICLFYHYEQILLFVLNYLNYYNRLNPMEKKYNLSKYHAT